jgi:anti-sigma B factor antagonist
MGVREDAMSLEIIITERHAGTYLVTMEGRLDTNTYFDFDGKMAPLLTGSARVLILDMAKLDYISSMGLRSINNARKAMKSHEGHMAFTNLQPLVQKIFEIVSPLPEEAVFAGVEEADRYFDWLQKKESE